MDTKENQRVKKKEKEKIKLSLCVEQKMLGDKTGSCL